MFKAKAKKPAVKYHKWHPMMLVHMYRMAKLGMTDKEICKALKPPIRPETLVVWKKDHPEVIETLELARRERNEGETIASWVYSRLSPELKVVWDKIVRWERQVGGVNKIELILQENGKLVRQQLFLYALCMCSFSVSQALRKVNLTKKELDYWIQHDLEFASLVQEIDWHKGNFFEEALVELVKQGDTAAVVFANKTYNGKRGYAPTSKLDVNVQGQVMHGVLDMAQLIPLLSDQTRSEVMSAIRKLEELELSSVPQKLTATERLDLEIRSLSGKVVEGAKLTGTYDRQTDGPGSAGK